MRLPRIGPDRNGKARTRAQETIMSAPAVIPGSPEDTAAALKAQQDADAAAAAAAAEGDGDGDGDGETVTMTKAEHDALQSASRLFKKQEKERKRTEADAAKAAARKEAQKKLDAAEAAGLGKEITEANAERDAARAETRALKAERSVELALREREWSPEARDLAMGQLDLDELEADDNGIPTDESITAALDELAEKYPKTFSASAQSGDGSKEPGVKTRANRRTPANPTLNEDGGDAKFEGYITPEDFMKATQAMRQDPEYWARVERSKAHWPDTFNHRLLRQE